MVRDAAIALLARLHAAQGAFYAGGPADALHELLTDDIAWHVPGDNVIAGDYEGRAAVMDYFVWSAPVTTDAHQNQSA
jgi:ketosteroid isomerase-like protein